MEIEVSIGEIVDKLSILRIKISPSLMFVIFIVSNASSVTPSPINLITEPIVAVGVIAPVAIVIVEAGA